MHAYCDTFAGHKDRFVALVVEASTIPAPPIAATRVQGALSVILTAGAVAVAIVVTVKAESYAVMAVTEVASIIGPKSKAVASRTSGEVRGTASRVATRGWSSRKAGATTSTTTVTMFSL